MKFTNKMKHILKLIIGASVTGIIALELILIISDSRSIGKRSVSRAPASSPRKFRAAANYVRGEVLVKFKPNTYSYRKQQVLSATQGFKIADLNSDGLSYIKLNSNQDVETGVEAFLSSPDVEYAQPNYIYKIQDVPNDPEYVQEWGLHNTGQTVLSTDGPDKSIASNNPGTLGLDMELESAWEYITDCSSVTVAVVDTGVNYNHVDLAANMWNGSEAYPKHGYNFIGNNDDPMDNAGHGTHVAGVIGSVGNNGIGTSGICWNVKIMAVKVLDATGSGTTATLTQGINFAVTHGAKVINTSIGGSVFDTALATAITNAQTNGVVISASAGNNGTNDDSGSTPNYPCNFGQPNLICVAALDQKYALASFSNYGSTSVDVGAPGVNVLSEWPGKQTTTRDALTSDWNGSSKTSTGWGHKSLFFGTPTNCLVDPVGYDYKSTYYSNSTDDRKWKSFDISGANAAVLDFWIMYDLELNADYVAFFVGSAREDPIPSGTTIGAVTGSSSGNRIERTYDISKYIGPNTTIGFELLSSSSNNNFGSNISSFAITSLIYDTSSYNVASGTSMAAPHVAGLAAMLLAYNPNYTYQDVVAAIKNGGTAAASLSGKTSTGKAINAMGSLAYINPPSGVTVIKQ